MADNKKYYYLKLKDSFFDSDEMIVLESMQDGYKYSNILMKLYCRSLKYNGRLMFNDRIPFNATMLAQITRHSVGDVEKAIKIFEQLDMIEVLDNGAIYMLDIQNFIGQSSTEADRKREYRAEIEQEKNMLLMTNVGQISGQMSDKSLSGGQRNGIKPTIDGRAGQMSDKNPPEIEKELEKELDIEQELDERNPRQKSLKAIGGYYKENGFGSFVSGIQNNFSEQLDSFIQIGAAEEEALQIILLALKRAVDQNKRKYAYAAGILRDWGRHRYLTVQQIEREDKPKRQYSGRKTIPDSELPDSGVTAF